MSDDKRSMLELLEDNSLVSEELTENFLTQYKIRKKMSAGYDESDSMETSMDKDFRQSSKVRPFDTDFKLGDIVMTSITSTPYPVVVALIREWEEGVFLVTPFSDYDYPATDQELYLPDQKKVLQIWGTLTIQVDNLKGWKIGELPEKYMDMAFQAFSFALTGKEMPFKDYIGTPILDFKDPRMGYINEQWDRIRELIAMDENAKKLSPKVKDAMGI